jgi:pimeloyl-ACP methyl ester carboxylesterase
MHLTSKSGARIAMTAQTVPQATATMIILHGFFSSRHSANITRALDALNAHGLNVIAPDFYGRGDSDGAFGDLTIATGIDTVETVLHHVRQHNPEHQIILTGGSFGGLIALHAIPHVQDEIAALILRAPVSDWRTIWLDWIGAEKLQAWDETGSFTDTIPSGQNVTFGRAFYDDLCRTDLYSAIAPQIRVPTLIVHGDTDETVPLSQSKTLRDVLPHGELIVLPGADHAFSRVDDSAAYQQHMIDFLYKNGVLKK